MACDNYQMDMSAPAFNTCKCGHPKSAHNLNAGQQTAKPAWQKKRGDASPQAKPEPIPEPVQPPAPLHSGPALPDGWITQTDPTTGRASSIAGGVALPDALGNCPCCELDGADPTTTTTTPPPPPHARPPRWWRRWPFRFSF